MLFWENQYVFQGAEGHDGCQVLSELIDIPIHFLWSLESIPKALKDRSTQSPASRIPPSGQLLRSEFYSLQTPNIPVGFQRKLPVI